MAYRQKPTKHETDVTLDEACKIHYGTDGVLQQQIREEGKKKLYNRI